MSFRKRYLRIRTAWLVAAIAGLALPSPGANDFGMSNMFKFKVDVPKQNTADLQHVRADNWRMVGKTVFVTGNVYIPYGNLTIRADKAMLDTESRDLEVKGNIRLFQVNKTTVEVTIAELERILQLPDTTVEITGYAVDPLGNQKIKIITYSEGGVIRAERLSGNFTTGYAHLRNLEMKLNTFICKAASGTRSPGGAIKVENAELSACSYLEDHQSHYSVSLKTANLYPHTTEDYGFSNMEADRGEYSVWGYNGSFNVFGVPVLWLPMFYKPKDESPGLFRVQFGEDSDWGYYILTSKKFAISDYPMANVVLDLDWYSQRGLGYGARVDLGTDNSNTVIQAYNIYDLRPYEGNSGLKDMVRMGTARLEIPHERFDFRITHLSHITPRLDFRGQLEYLSDAYMLGDYFSNREQTMTEPASYAALEYQFDRASASIYTRVQVNKFFTTVQRLPELRLDLPRQEILPGTNLYYQGSHTASYLEMRWAEFDFNYKNPKSRLENYRSGRFDSVNFLYYPMRLGWLNVLPRAGMRLTGYTNSSKHKVTSDDIYFMQLASNNRTDFGFPVNNYDDNGDSRFRFAWELGVEANTKIYRSWQNVKSAFWGLDGLRHVMEPYVNYTFLPKPTEDRDYLYYFDDVDRIREENFVRLGLRNRLQTRDGGFTNASIREWFQMENYWDLYFNKEKNYSQIGDFCTKFTFNPTKEFSFFGYFSIDAGQNQDHDGQAIRNGRAAGRPGMSGKIFNRLYLGISYAPIEDLIFSLTYDYKDNYSSRAAYSMGSTLTEIESGSAFDRNYYAGRTQTVNFGVQFPVTPDRKTVGAYNISYDFEMGGIDSQELMLSRVFHCFRVTLLLSQERENNGGNRGHDYNHEISASVSLVGLEAPLDAVKRTAVQKFTEMY